SKGEGHAWNLVSINGKYYQLDVTWDDPIMADGSHALYHHYFNLTDADMALDHQWNKADYPSCTATDSNYFVVNKLLAQSQNDFVNLVVDRVEQGASEVSVKIVNFVTSGFDYEMATTLAFDRLNRGGSYSVNDIQGIVDISFQ
ncbi:MAG: hypothetical protein N2376_12785, partial [Clostridia bacterium]|nr:hypothetical protein [Clostridia bacterium]